MLVSVLSVVSSSDVSSIVFCVVVDEDDAVEFVTIVLCVVDESLVESVLKRLLLVESSLITVSVWFSVLIALTELINKMLANSKIIIPK